MHTSRQSRLNQRGQALSEYAILVAIVGMGLVVILGLFGQATKRVWVKSERSFADDPTVASTSPSPSPPPAVGGGGGGGGGPSGSAQHSPPPADEPPPKQSASDSGSSAADSSGASPGGAIVVQANPVQ